MNARLTAIVISSVLACAACQTRPGLLGIAGDSHRFQCHAASPGPCSYVVFNESGSVREAFFLSPGQSRLVNNVGPHTGFCLAVEKPLDPTKCERLGLDGKPLQR
jgi:hypothetical protein